MLTPRKDIYLGIFLLRAGMGAFFIIHGMPILFGGPDTWELYGEAAGYLGFNAYPVVFGFLAAITLFFGGILLLLGLYLKPALIILIVTMALASIQLIAEGNPYLIYSHPMKMILVFIVLLILGPGKYNLDDKMKSTLRRRSRRL